MKLILGILLYPYPHQYFQFFMGLIMLLVIGLPAYGIYRLIIWKMNVKVKSVFHRILIIAGISIFIFFIVEGIVSIITMHHVNKQLGFGYATPDTPEGELFLITKVVLGKTMDKAGLKPNDQVQMNDVNKLYKLLINNQGKEVIIPVVRNKKKIEIRVKVPELDLPMANLSLLF